MLPDRLSNPGPLTYESGALPIALRGSAVIMKLHSQLKRFPPPAGLKSGTLDFRANVTSHIWQILSVV